MDTRTAAAQRSQPLGNNASQRSKDGIVMNMKHPVGDRARGAMVAIKNLGLAGRLNWSDRTQSRPAWTTTAGLVRRAREAVVFVGTVFLCGAAAAATYYVDPTSGNDSNVGTSQAAPWQTIPGWGSTSTHGSFNASNKIPAGSVIEIKAGSTFIGQRLQINSTYYASPASTAQRTAIIVSPTWGAGNVVIDGAGATVPAYNGGIQVTDISYITLKGAGTSRRLEVKGYSANYCVLFYNRSSSAPGVGNELKWFDVHNCSTYGIGRVWQNNGLDEDGLAHHNGTNFGAGHVLGDFSDAGGDGNVIRRVVSYSNSAAAKPNDGSNAFGFQQTGATNFLYDSCEAYGNGRDGFDAGRADNAGDSNGSYINSFSHDNGEDGFGANSGPTGVVKFNYVNVISVRNGQANWTVYDGAKAYIYNSLGWGGGAMIHSFKSYAAMQTPEVHVRNSYLAKPNGSMLHYYNLAAGSPIVTSNNSLWIPRASNSEPFDDTGTGITFANGPSWKGASDRFGIAYAQAFVNAAADDYRLADSTGPANNAGTVLTTPSGVGVDRAGMARATPPDIGPYEFASSAPQQPPLQPPPAQLAAPTNLRIM